MTYSTAEREAIGLCIAWEAIDNLVNRALLDLSHADTHPDSAVIPYPTMIHRDLFLIRLLDFSKELGQICTHGRPGLVSRCTGTRMQKPFLRYRAQFRRIDRIDQHTFGVAAREDGAELVAVLTQR